MRGVLVHGPDCQLLDRIAGRLKPFAEQLRLIADQAHRLRLFRRDVKCESWPRKAHFDGNLAEISGLELHMQHLDMGGTAGAVRCKADCCRLPRRRRFCAGGASAC